MEEKNRLSELLQQQDGALCSLQYAMIGGFSLFWIGWLIVAFQKQTLPDVPAGVLTLLGLMLASKVWKDSVDYKATPVTPVTPKT